MRLDSLGFVAHSAPTGGAFALDGTVRSFYAYREPVALLSALAFMVLMSLSMQYLHFEAPISTPPTLIRLVEIPDVPALKEPPPESAPIPPRQPTPQHLEKPIPEVEVAEPPPKPAPTPPVTIPVPAIKPAPPAEIAPPTPQRSNPNAEGAYQTRARALIEKNKRYPEDALQMGMTGAVVILYTISRDGRLLRAEIDRSSGHTLLDQAALKAVRQTRFDPMPDDAWANAKEQSFRTRIEYNIE